MVRYEDLHAAAVRGDAAFVLENADLVLIQGECPPEKVGWVFYYKCDAALGAEKNVLAIAAGEQALTWARQHKDEELEGRVMLCLSQAMLRLGRVAEGAKMLESYLAGMKKHKVWQKHEDVARYNLGWAYRHSGRLQDAVVNYRKALELNESWPGSHVHFRQNLAWALMLLGDAQGAKEQLEMVAAAVRETLSLDGCASLWVDRAALYLLEGDAKAAKAACQQVLDALDERTRAVHLATTYVTLGRIALNEGNREEAQRCSMLARTHAEKAERWDLHNEATRLWVSASEKGGLRHEEDGLGSVIRLLVSGRGD